MDKLSQLLGDNNPYKYLMDAKSVMDQKTNERAIRLQRLCFELFHILSDGKELYQILLDDFIIPSKFSPFDTNASLIAMYWHGFKDALRGLYNNGSTHQQRINEGQPR